MTRRKTAEPPEFLFCAVDASKTDQAYRHGLNRRKMASMALYDNPESARRSKGKKLDICIFVVLANVMIEDGYEFFQTNDNLWHTTEIPPKYLRFQ